MPNPTWTLNVEQVEDFFRLLARDPGAVYPAGLSEGVLGFRGLVVTMTGAEADRMTERGFPPQVRIVGDLVAGTSELVSSLAVTEPQSAMEADSLAGPDLAVFDLFGSLSNNDNEGNTSLYGAACSLSYTSWNNFSFWNGSRRQSNNCYNYGANWASNTFAQPGRLGGRQIPYAATDGQFSAGMQADNWDLTCSGSSIRVFAVTGSIYTPSGWIWDYHFYRKNLDGAGERRWCHKPGQTPATNRDASGNYISNPRTADRAGSTFNYNHEVGLFFSPPGTRYLVVR